MVLIVLAFISDETPDLDDTGEEVISFYTDNEGSQFVSAILAAATRRRGWAGRRSRSEYSR